MSVIAGLMCSDLENRIQIWNTMRSELQHRSRSTRSYVGPDICILASDLFVLPVSANPRKCIVAFSSRKVSSLGKVKRRLDSEKDGLELVVEAYLHWGEGFFQELDVDIDLGLYDERNGTLLLFRDRVGQQPVYYTTRPNQFAFSPDIKALLTAGPVGPKINDAALLSSFFFTLPNANDHETCFRNVHSLPPAHQCEFSFSRGLRLGKHFEFKLEPRSISIEDAVEQFKETFLFSLNRATCHHESVGISVSGGLDSSAIYSSVMSAPKLFKTHGISYISNSEEANEQNYIRDLEEKFGQEIAKLDLDQMSWVQDDPFEQARITESPLSDSLWALTRMVNRKLQTQKCTLIMSGHFGDQVLFNHFYLADLLRKRQLKLFRTHLDQYSLWMSLDDVEQKKQQVYGAFAKSLAPEWTIDTFKKIRSYWKTEAVRDRLQGPRMKDLKKKSCVREKADHSSFHSRYMNGVLQSKYHLDSLEIQNKTSAHFGMDLYLPYMDSNLIQLLMQMPGEILTYQGVPKNLLRMSMVDILPPSVRTRNWKADFTSFVSKTAEANRDYFQETLNSKSFIVKEGLVDELEVRRTLEQSLQTSNASPIWDIQDLVQLENWCQFYFNGGRSKTVVAQPVAQPKDADRTGVVEYSMSDTVAF